MSKKPAKPAAKPTAADAADAPRKRSKARLVLTGIVPLLLAGGGYAGWTFFLQDHLAGGEAHAAAVEGEHAAENGGEAHGEAVPEASRVPALPPEIAAETSFTYSFALSQLLAERCGAVNAPALQAASEAEARTDGLLVNLSWQAAHRRSGTVTERSCDYMRAEIWSAESRARRLAEEQQAAAAGEGASHH